MAQALPAPPVKARSPAAITLLMLVPLVLLVLFAMGRVAAPAGLLGLVFDEPRDFGLFALAFVAASLLLMAIPAVDRFAGRKLNGAREPTAAELAQVEPLLADVAARAGMDVAKLHLLVQDHDGINAAAGGGRILFVTTGALRLPDETLAAVLAHELGHHRDLFPVVGVLIWWVRLPTMPLRWLAVALKRAIGRIAARFGRPLSLLAVPLQLAVLVIEVNLLWIVYVAEIIASWLSRQSELRADRHAADWGYGEPLAGMLAIAATHEPPQGRLERLMDDHPPPADRIHALV